jgi:hypothetical protein
LAFYGCQLPYIEDIIIPLGAAKEVIVESGGDIWMGEWANVGTLIGEKGQPKEGWVYRNTTDNCVYKYKDSAWLMIVDGSLTTETVTNIQISGDYLQPGERHSVLVYFPDGTVDSGYIDGSTGSVVVNSLPEYLAAQAFHTLRLLDTNKRILLGRKFNEEPIELAIDSLGDLQFRAAISNPNDTSNTYIPIGTVGEFALIGTATGGLGGRYLQTNDLDMLGSLDAMSDMPHNWAPVGYPSFQFTGTFDGCGKDITNLVIDRMLSGNIGLFGYVSSSGIIRDTHIRSGRIAGGGSVGGVAGRNDGIIKGCSNAADIFASETAGGVAGNSSGGRIENSSNSGNVRTTSGPAGGVVCTGIVLIACSNSGEVSAGAYAGGVAGSSSIGGSIIACYNSGSVSSGSIPVGGVIGIVSGAVTACYNSGSVSGSNPVGGIVGYVNGGSITACFNAGTVSGSGGIAGTAFDEDNWPSAFDNGQWGVGSGGDGSYWGDLGGWNDGAPIFPKLWFE